MIAPLFAAAEVDVNRKLVRSVNGKGDASLIASVLYW